MTLKIGLVGAGKMVQIAHLPHLLQIGGVQPVAVADIDVGAAQRLATAYNIPSVYDSSQALIDGEPELDGVIVVTPRMIFLTPSRMSVVMPDRTPSRRISVTAADRNASSRRAVFISIISKIARRPRNPTPLHSSQPVPW